MDISDAPALFVPEGNEESVDIYEGLDFGSSCNNVVPEKSAPSGLKDAMDLFEEIVTEEQQSKEATYTELKSRFHAAQGQITELHRRLEQLQLQNTGLTKENCQLKMNISILLKTAKQEITRKDTEILRLNQLCSKDQYLQSRLLRGSGCSNQNQRLPPPSPLDPPASTALQRLSRHHLLPSKEAAAPPAPPSAPPAPPAASEPPPLTHMAPDAAAPLPPPPPTETPSQPDRPPLPPPPSSPPPPAPPLPTSSLREDVPVPNRGETQKCVEPGSRSSEQNSCNGLRRRSLREDCQTSERLEKNRHHTDKHKDKKHQSDSQRKGTSSNPSTDRHERRHSHKDRTSNFRDSKSTEKNSKVFTAESDHDKGHGSKDARSRDDRRDRARDRPSRSSDSKELKHHWDSSRSDRRLSKDQPSKGGRQERRDEGDAKRHRRDSKEKHRSKEHNKKSSKSSERSSKEKTVKVVVEENSPHRKLCFMETLNLTLSPVKKPGLDCEGGQKEPDATEEAPQDVYQPDMKDMCVLDEVDSSEPEAASVDCPETVAEASKTKTLNKRKDVEETVSSVSTTCDNEVLEDSSVHSTSASKAGIQKENSLPKCVGEQTQNSEETATKTSTSEETLPVNPSEAVESIDTSHDSKTTGNVKESAVSVTVEGSSEAPNEAVRIPPNNTLLASPTSTQSRDVSSQEVTSKEVETVSSSISLESLPPEGLGLTEAIDFLMQNNENCSSPASTEPTSTACIEVPKVSSTTQETTALDKYAQMSKTPKKSLSPTKFLSSPRSSEKGVKPSSSVPLLYDEDSMMRTLSNLKRIPDAISPLRSPVRISKRNLQHLQKPGHVKSLHKEFSSAPADAISKKVDVNKENKHPGSPAKADPVDRVLAVPLDTELEEGEILSDSDEAASPHPPTKRAKLKRPVRTKASPKCVLKRKTEEKSDKEITESPETVPSPPNKSRFKTVCPAATKASFSSIEEVMDTFKLVRYEIRKKYMKLHKTFPKKSFYGVMENFQESFVEFVDGADFGQICNRTKDLKSKLKKVITSVFSKVLDNGIVKRIFEQQAVDLKQKLWDFVDVQVDYLFKDAHTTLKSICKPGKSPAKQGNTRENDKRCKQSPEKRKEAQSPRRLSAPQSKPCAVVPFRTGLGSRGKGIRITLDKTDDTEEQSGSGPSTLVSIVSSTPEKVVSIVSSTPEKINSSLVMASNTTALDKTDFELLTEQQASSLTFNLVRDSQMGEIFKCLIQGSDLLDTDAPGDQSSWALSTPRKDGERIITITTPGKFHTPSKLLTPSKFESPSRLITTWSSISPRKVSSPSSKLLLNPALFDESCLLEVPSENKIPQRPYSILAEDLAVSLTIPSPLKSDSHLSFLQPPPVQVLSTPDSVLSAHISEDALLDEADATEHDIHLTLDTDNSSCSSSTSVGSSHGMSSQFLFKPDLPMQALVMERSTDHFVVKIRQASSANSTLIANESLNQTLIEEIDSEGSSSTGVQSSQVQEKSNASIQSRAQNGDNSLCKSPMEDPIQKDSGKEQIPGKSNSQTSPCTAPQPSTSNLGQTDEAARTKEAPQGSSDSSEVPSSQTSSLHTSSSDREEIVSESERSLTIVEELETTPEKSQARKHKDRKRRKSQESSKAKRHRADEDSNQEMSCETTGEETLSPNSLSAKNVVRRKGEVVIAWTREEDRAILIELKTKGASRETFSYLSEKLDKPSAQIAQRFHQLMKLFKKMDT